MNENLCFFRTHATSDTSPVPNAADKEQVVESFERVATSDEMLQFGDS